MKKIITLFSALFLLSLSVFAQTDFLVLGSYSSSTYLQDVVDKIDADPRVGTVAYINTYNNIPTLAQLQAYDAVLVFTDSSPQDATKLGDTLAAYIEWGGGVVNCVFSTASVAIEGKFETDYELIIENGNQEDGTRYTLGTINVTNSALIQGVTTFDGGSSSYRAENPTMVSGCTVVAEWSDGDPLVVVKDGIGPMSVSRVDLNFYPPSDDVSSDFWDSSTDGGLLMSNALLYVSGAVTTSNLSNTGMNVTGIYPNPSNGQFSVSLNSTVTASDVLQVADVYGKIVYTTPVSVVSGSNVYAFTTALPKGIYFLSLTGTNTKAGKLVIE